jgi:hypothetical protein
VRGVLRETNSVESGRRTASARGSETAPNSVVTNHDLAERLGIADDQLDECTGIPERRMGGIRI